MLTNQLDVIAIVGPTGSGKTDLGIRIARKFGGEIICADARTVYRGMDIGTAKVVPPGIRHHLVDIRDPNESYSVAEFVRDAQRCIAEIVARGKLPIIVGGTGLYVRALLRGYAIPLVPPDPLLRARLERRTTAALVRELERRDPEAARTIDAHNRRRLIRAIEVCRAAGPRSRLPTRGDPPYHTLLLGIAVPRETLYRRIDRRTAAWIRAGLLTEVRHLLRKYPYDPPVLRGLVYREVGDALLAQPRLGRKGTEDDVAALVARVNGALHAYARRQMTWFRKEKGIRWVQSTAEADAAVRKFLARMREPASR